jgi:hypothetical protein
MLVQRRYDGSKTFTGKILKNSSKLTAEVYFGFSKHCNGLLGTKHYHILMHTFFLTLQIPCVQVSEEYDYILIFSAAFS